MPPDHRGERIDHVQPPHTIVVQRGHRRVAQAQAADEHREFFAFGGSEAERRQLLLGDGEQARHEVLVLQLHLVDQLTRGRISPPAKCQLPHPRLLPVQLFESHDHGCTSSLAEGTTDAVAAPSSTLAPARGCCAGGGSSVDRRSTKPLGVGAPLLRLEAPLIRASSPPRGSASRRVRAQRVSDQCGQSGARGIPVAKLRTMLGCCDRQHSSHQATVEPVEESLTLERRQHGGAGSIPDELHAGIRRVHSLAARTR